jgi:hypothetical protein
MLPAIQLDSELQSRAIEIQDVVPGWMLPAKAGAIDLCASQLLPQPSLHVGGTFAKLARSFGLDEGTIEARTSRDLDSL